MSELIRDEIIHFSVSLLTGIIIGYLSQSYTLAIGAALLGGFFIDSDHLFDYFKFYGWNFNLKKFFAGEHFDISRKMYVPFHGWEWIPILLLSAYVVKDLNLGVSIVILSFGISLFFHIIIDVITNDIPVELYSLLFRISHGFPGREAYKEMKTL